MNLIVTGSIAFDYLMCFNGYFRDYLLPDKLDSISLSFLVDSLTIQRGGNAANIAYTMALLGEHPRLMGAAGRDFTDYRQWLDGNGVDTSEVGIFSNVMTASFFANTDLSNAQIASFYPGAMAYARELSFRHLKGSQPDLVTISPNDPEAMVRHVKECRELGIPYFYDPSQQIVRTEAAVLRDGIEGAQAFLVNEYEYCLVQQITGMDQAEILSHVKLLLVTLGEHGAVIYTPQEEFHISIVTAERIMDPTGVGDAFRGGFLVGYGRGWPLTLCGQMGALAATYCIENLGPQGQHYTPDEFATRFRKHYDDQGKLDELGKKPNSD
jgi:adenosine kinase